MTEETLMNYPQKILDENMNENCWKKQSRTWANIVEEVKLYHRTNPLSTYPEIKPEIIFKAERIVMDSDAQELFKEIFDDMDIKINRYNHSNFQEGAKWILKEIKQMLVVK